MGSVGIGDSSILPVARYRYIASSRPGHETCRDKTGPRSRDVSWSSRRVPGHLVSCPGLASTVARMGYLVYVKLTDPYLTGS